MDRTQGKSRENIVPRQEPEKFIWTETREIQHLDKNQRNIVLGQEIRNIFLEQEPQRYTAWTRTREKLYQDKKQRNRVPVQEPEKNSIWT